MGLSETLVHGFFQGRVFVASIRSTKRAVIISFIFWYAFMGFPWVWCGYKKAARNGRPGFIMGTAYAASGFFSSMALSALSAWMASICELRRESILNVITTRVVDLFFASIGERLGCAFCTCSVTASSSPSATSLGST